MKKIRRYGNLLWDFKDKKVYEVVEVQRSKPRNTNTANCYECDVIYIRGRYILGMPNAKLWIEYDNTGDLSMINMPLSVQALENDLALHMAMKDVQRSLFETKRAQKNLILAKERVQNILLKYKGENRAL